MLKSLFLFTYSWNLRENMNYSKFQKFTSFILIFSLLFSITFRVPFFEFLKTVKAEDDNFYSLVSIIVDEDTYQKIWNKIDRYAKDIQWVLENTRAVILPVPTDADAIDISSLNEWLYFEGYKSLKNVSFESRLVWTVLVWNIPLPVLSDNNKTTKSIVPYTDFENKAYIFNHQSWYYEKNGEASELVSPEVWHWVISPNSWNNSIDIEQLEAFFNKTHDYYLWVWNFDSSKWIINGNQEQGNPVSYEPFVFYFDQFREEKAVYYPWYKWYTAYLDNKEDIVYNRFSKDLAQKIKEEVLWAQNDEISDLINSISDEKIKEAFDSQQESNLDNVSDISTRTITQEALNKFIEVFNWGALEDIRTNVHNAWRYNWDWSNVNVDFIPYLVSIIDVVSDELIKNVNTDIENKIDDLVKNGLSRNIPILESYSTDYKDGTGNIAWWDEWICSSLYINFLHWKDASTIRNASECTIYRWSTYNSWTLVEANRWLNIKNIETDFIDLKNLWIVHCPSMMWTQWYWWWNSPVNLNQSDMMNVNLKLSTHDLNWSVRPLYDILGSSKIENASMNPNPLNCYDNNLILTNRVSQDIFQGASTCEVSYNVPLWWSNAVWWTCDSNNIKKDYYNSFKDDYELFSWFWIFDNCTIERLNLSWRNIKSTSIWLFSSEECIPITEIEYNYNSISSYITHKSPTSQELYLEITNPITPNLPIDKDRYIDFISANWNYAKIQYPYLFRVGALTQNGSNNLSFDEQIYNIESVLNDYLSSKSSEINSVIRINNPSTLTWVDLEIYELFKTWLYPSANINLIEYLKNKPIKTIEINWEQKNISYYDYLVFSIYWSNLNSVSAKYKFILEYYLSDQFWGNNFDFILPKNKKIYEIAYLWASWDAQNMYVKIDPESKWENPFWDIISSNSLFDSSLLWVKATSYTTENTLFKCAPPEWVPIWEWIPAVICRINDMLPPTIKLSSEQCGWDLLNEVDLFNLKNYEDEHSCINWDKNKNWINDCIENWLNWWSLVLSSSTWSYWYNKIWDLKAIIKDSLWDKILIDNETYVQFYIKEIKTSEWEVIYNRWPLNESIIEKINKYIYFNEDDVRAVFWEANYTFSTKNKDVDIVFWAFLEKKDNEWNIIYALDSNDFLIQVRKENTSDSNLWEINNFLWDASKIELNIWSTVLESWWSVSTNVVTIYDDKWDIASWKYYEIELSILGDSLEFENGGKSIVYTTFEWFRAFRVRSTGEDWISKIRVKLIKNEENSLLTSKDIKVVSDIELYVALPSEQFKVWGNTYNLNIEIQDNLWNWISDFNSRLYLNIPSKYWRVKKDYFDVVNWVANVEFETAFVAWKDVPFEFQVEGLNGIYKKYFNIVPEKPMKIDLKTMKSKLEASSSAYTYVEATLKDIYWNIAFNDNSTRLNIELPKKYKDIIILDETSKTVNNGEAKFKINATELPWTAYLKVSSTPSLNNNSYEIDWQTPFLKNELTISWFKQDWILSDLWKKFFYEVDSTSYRSLFNKIEDLQKSDDYKSLSDTQQTSLLSLWNENNKYIIYWVWENAIQIDTYYFWSADKIQWKKYNSLYTVLLWSNYWDFTVENYLASWILFDRDNRWLAVTTLLNNPYNYNDIVQISSNWSIQKVYNNFDLTQDININLEFNQNNVPYLDLFNNSLNTEVGKIFFNFQNKVNIKECTKIECTENLNETTIFFKNNNSNYSIYKFKNGIELRNSLWQAVFKVSDDWKIYTDTNITLELDTTLSKATIFNVKVSNTTIWQIWFYFVDNHIKIARDNIALNWLLGTSPNSIIIFLNNNDYNIRDILSSDTSEEKSIYYHDPFDDDLALDNFTKENLYSYENFAKQEWLWWKSWNKSILEFASWKNVWESVLNFASVWLINLWDPVISLKNRERTLPWTDIIRKFDRTIWKKINSTEISSYQVFDYNDDWKDDILLIWKDKYFKLLENKDIHWDFLNQRNLARVVDLWNENLILAWDFTWDNYEDIFFVNNEWNPYLLNNFQKDFLRIDLESQFDLNAKIIKSKVFDMDNDEIDDIIVLDDSWKIVIFYWWWNSTSPQFTKNIVSNDYWITLNNQVRDDLWAVYFDWLYQLSDEGDNSELLESYENFNWNIDDILNKLLDENSDVYSVILSADESLMDWFIFVRVPYNSKSSDDIIFSSELDWSLNNLTNNLENLIDYNTSDISQTSNRNSQVTSTFIRSQYSYLEWLKVEKNFNDENWWTLKSWDIVLVDVTLTNTSSNTISDIAYLEDIPNMFSLDTSSILNNKNIEVKSWVWTYKFLVENFSLAPSESIEILYKISTRPLSYGFIDVWLFEEGEVWDDLYGDIIFKLDEQNCSETVDIFRSVNSRSYKKWEKEPTCDLEKLELPEELQNNLLDSDWNGVPDYIDELSNWDSNAIKNYANKIEQEVYLDSDNDGIPDREDISPNYSWDNNILLDFWLDVDEISDWIDDIVRWFWCWFGWWSCISMPLNWAPLAPWSDPTVLWYPVWDWLKVWEWLPFFSALTWLQTMCWTSPCCIPTVWPVSSLAYKPGPVCWSPSAGGRLWTWSPTNYVRLFYTPTLTWANWFAACYWGPAIVAWNSLPMGVSPIVPGGNCVVAAFPMDFCSEEQNWDPTSLWIPNYFGEFWIINWNCDSSTKNDATVDNTKLEESLVQGYLNYKNTWVQSSDFINKLKEAFKNPSWPSYQWEYSTLSNTPLVSMDWGNDGFWSISVDIDLTAIKEGNFEDVIQIKNTKISAFPSFLMDWVDRQIEEIITKLTDFPTLFIILPDFSSIYNGDWWEYMLSWVQKSYSEWVEKQEKIDSNADAKISSLETKKQQLNCEVDYSVECSNLDLDIENEERGKWFWYGKEYSGIKEAYEFLSNTPLVSIDPEPVTLNIPWIDSTTLNKTIEDWKITAEWWKQELEDAKNSWSYWESCDEGDTQCEKENSIKEKFVIDTSKTIYSLERNIQILEDYKKFPEKLSTLVNKKQDRLNQILCNLETISNITWGWIWKNGERFKAWVELYVLIKATLKSWQLLADIFIDYDAQCHECKNERYDLIGYITKLIDIIIPKIPVIQFPKWPDIVLDLHNIRLHLEIKIPDFNFNLRPIVLPILPELNLPDSPSLTISLPVIPELPVIVLPELPNIPTLPTIELPNLPPPPNLPKLFWALEGILDILKLLTKIMCILKKSPFVPEWRAWDQIAYITERGWYLPFDFLDISLPQFSFPFVDAIEVTTYVNLEFDAEFLVEMSRALAIPLNSFTNNTVPLFDIKVNNINVWKDVPQHIDLDLWWTSFKDNGKVNMSLKDFIKVIAVWINKLEKSIESTSRDELTSKQFLEFINKELSKKKLASDPKLNDLREVWSKVNEMTYSNEDKLINDLIKTNNDKFEAVKNILNTEKLKNDELKEQIKSLDKPEFISKVWVYKDSDFDSYNKSLDAYNKKFIDSANALVVWENKQEKEFKQMWEVVLQKVKPVLNEYSSYMSSNNLLSTTTSTTWNSSWNTNLCQQANSQDYKYNYKWLYVVEEVQSTSEKISYNLFDYHDELTWKESLVSIDFDSDNDEDLLYQMWTDLYLKENLNIRNNKLYIKENPLYVSVWNNKFVNWDIYYEAINNFEEKVVYAWTLNMWFSASNREDINNYRIEYYPIVDKYMNKDNNLYIPNWIKKYVIDAFSDSSNIWLVWENEIYKTSKNISYIKSAWENLNWVKLYTKKLHTINNDLNNNQFVSISKNTKVYSWKSNVKIFYLQWDETRTVDLDKYTNIEFKQPVKIYKIIWWEVYVPLEENDVIIWQEILNFIWKPILLWSRIEVVWDFYNNFDERSHIDLKYYDGSEYWLDLRELSKYEIYDLWYKNANYLININTENDYYYARSYVFSNNIAWTYSKQILLSPQNEADQNAPELIYSSKIRLPVYQEKIIDFSEYIYENTWINNIKNVSINWINDDEYTVLQSTGKIRIKFWKFDELFIKEIQVKLTDTNNNESIRTLKLEVYSPVPKIDIYVDDMIQWKINEELIDEPVSVYRIRGGSITRLKDASLNNLVSTQEWWNYIFNTLDWPSYIVFKKNEQEIFRVDEYTWKINFISNAWDYSIDVITSNSLDYPEIRIKDKQNEEIFYEKITLKWDLYINEVNDFTYTDENWLYVMMMNENYSYYKLPEAISYNPWSFVIYRNSDSTKAPLFTISKDWRIKTLNDYYKLEYTSFDDYVVFKMMDKHYNREVARVMFRIENGFVIQ